MMVLRMRLVGYLIMKYLIQYERCVVLTFLNKEPTSKGQIYGPLIGSSQKPKNSVFNPCFMVF
jgi:hypothetical protein